MKFRFNEAQLEYLDVAATTMKKSIRRADIQEGTARTVYKMSHKFKKSALDIFLSQKERGLLSHLLTYRLDRLVNEHSNTGESELIVSIMKDIKL